MKHASIRQLFEYWNARRGARAAPERADIEAGEIRHVLADTFILALDPRAGHPFRVAGTRACALLGRELKGVAFLDLWAGPSRDMMRELVDVVRHEAIGVLASASGADRKSGTPDLELLILPLSHAGRTDTRLLGALAATRATWWLDTRPLASLSLGTFRYLGPAVSGDGAPGIAAGTFRGLRHGLVVYDGGLL